MSELKAYQDAVWAYLLEHSDITENGAIFIKFHTKSRTDFEKHLKGRWKYGYHRIDQRTGETHEQKEARATAQRELAEGMKALKRQRWEASREERRKVFAAVERENEKRRRRAAFAREHPFVHRIVSATACIGVLLRHHYEKLQARHNGETKAQTSHQESEGESYCEGSLEANR